MKNLQGFYNLMFMLIFSLFMLNLNKKYGIYFDEDFKNFFNIAMTAGAEMSFYFVYSIIADIVDNKIK